MDLMGEGMSHRADDVRWTSDADHKREEKIVVIVALVWFSTIVAATLMGGAIAWILPW